MNPWLAGRCWRSSRRRRSSAGPTLERERQPREGFGASGAWDVVVGEQVGGRQAGGQWIPAATSASASSKQQLDELARFRVPAESSTATSTSRLSVRRPRVNLRRRPRAPSPHVRNRLARPHNSSAVADADPSFRRGPPRPQWSTAAGLDRVLRRGGLRVRKASALTETDIDAICRVKYLAFGMKSSFRGSSSETDLNLGGAGRRSLPGSELACRSRRKVSCW